MSSELRDQDNRRAAAPIGGEEAERRLRPSLAVAIALALVAVPVLLWQVHAMAERLLLDGLAQRSTQLLELYAEGMRGTLDRYRAVPLTLALYPAVDDLLSAPGDPVSVARANRLFEQVNDMLGSDEIYLMDTEGLTLAASNWDNADSFVGRNFAFRPYFRDALQGQLGRYFALGTTSGQRGYYFASPVRRDNKIAGVMVLKVDIGSLESGWGGAGHDVMATDEDGVVFMASRRDWIYRSIRPLSPETQAGIAASRRYPDKRIEPLAGYAVVQGGGERELVQFPGEADEEGPAEMRLAVSRELVDAGFTLRILSATSAVRGQALAATTVAGGLVAVGALLGLWLSERRRRLRARLAQQAREQSILARAAAELENRVDQRTKALQHEIDERRRAEEELRRAQEDLVQAGKLAALGQLASGISHELSQPLTAIGTYADNARQFLERDRTSDAIGNLATIRDLVSRAAKIMDHLRVFARKTPMQIGPVTAAESIRNSVSLLKDVGRLKGTEVNLDIDNTGLQVLAEPVRLEQVLINLLQNAADAVRGVPNPAIAVTQREHGAYVEIAVTDNGPGIDESDLPHIFEPFFSTKPVGKGMGLGLSISYGIVEALGGSLKARPGPEGGAVFTLRLPRAAQDSAKARAAHG